MSEQAHRLADDVPSFHVLSLKCPDWGLQCARRVLLHSNHRTVNKFRSLFLTVLTACTIFLITGAQSPAKEERTYGKFADGDAGPCASRKPYPG